MGAPWNAEGRPPMPPPQAPPPTPHPDPPPDHPSPDPKRTRISQNRSYQSIGRVKKRMSTPGDPWGPPKNMIFSLCKFLLVASPTFIFQKLPIFSFPKPRDYQNQILRAILPRIHLLSPPLTKFFAPPRGPKNRYHSFSHSLHIRPPMFKNSLFLAFPGLGDLKYGNYVKF